MNNYAKNIAEFKNISVSYDDYYALKNITFSIKNGEHTVILGANGSGKSTLIKLFSNDIYPRIYNNSSKKIFDKEVWNIFELKNYLGIITNDMHYNMLDIAANISGYDAIISSFFSSIGRFEHQEYTKEYFDITNSVISMLGIENLMNKPLSNMSTGELRKCVIARALVHKPKALLLDEPTTGLDIKAQIEFLHTIRDLSKHLTIILITHHIEEIIPEIQKAILLKNGEIAHIGKKEDILTSKNLSEIFNIDLKLEYSNNRYKISSIN